MTPKFKVGDKVRTKNRIGKYKDTIFVVTRTIEQLYDGEIGYDLIHFDWVTKSNVTPTTYYGFEEWLEKVEDNDAEI